MAHKTFNQSGIINNLFSEVFSHDWNNLLIFGIGNLSRGDDGAGPLFLQLLEQQLSETIDKKCIQLEEVFQLQPECIYDIENKDCVVFVDAALSHKNEMEISLVEPVNAVQFTSHAVSPAQCLYWYKHYFNTVPPRSYLLSIPSESFELDKPVSEYVQKLISSGVSQFVQCFTQHSKLKEWSNDSHA